MIVRVPITDVSHQDFEVGVVSFEPSYDSGMEWRTVGTRWVCEDRGMDTAHHGSSVRIIGPHETLLSLFNAVGGLYAKGDFGYVLCETYEQIFGPHILQGALFPCIVSCSPVSIGEGNTFMASATLTVSPMVPMHPFYAGDPEWSTDVATVSVERSAGQGGRTHVLYEGSGATGDGLTVPTAEVTFMGTRAQAAGVLEWVETNRGVAFTWDLSSSGHACPFVDGETSPEVVVLDVSYGSPIDRAALWHTYTLTIGRAT